MPLMGFETKIPASKWWQTHVTDRAFTGTGELISKHVPKNLFFN
jgi:hypothetical protein